MITDLFTPEELKSKKAQELKDLLLAIEDELFVLKITCGGVIHNRVRKYLGMPEMNEKGRF